MITTDSAFTEYLERTIWTQGKPAPSRDELVQLENAFMAKLGAVKPLFRVWKAAGKPYRVSVED